MSGHTKGNWTLDATGETVLAPAPDGDGDRRGGQTHCVALAYRVGHGNEATTKANARLIAAAPDLLEACEAAIGVDGHIRGGHCTSAGCDEACETIDAAIRKATT